MTKDYTLCPDTGCLIVEETKVERQSYDIDFLKKQREGIQRSLDEVDALLAEAARLEE